MRDKDIIKAAYDVVAGTYAQVVQVPGGTGGPERDTDLAMIRKFTALLPAGAEVLDAGCGTGRMITYLDTLAQENEQPLVIQGCDLSEAMVAIARDAHPNRRILAADLAALPYTPQSFDALLAWYSIIHATPEELAGIFCEFRRVLRPGGVLLLGFQAGSGQRRITNAYGQGVEMTACLHSVPEVLAALQSIGFQEVASLDRGPEGAEGNRQGFVLAELESSR